MNSLLKIILLSTLLLFFVSNANAAYTDMNALDANGVRHANRGEDFNVSISVAQTADVNSDYNYIVALSYRGIYVDLNITGFITGTDSNAASVDSSSRIDANVVTMTLSGAGPCASGGDYNVIKLSNPSALEDLNTFNVKARVPATTDNCTTCRDLNHMIGKEVAVELWPLTAAGVRTGVCGSTYDANAPFIIGPAIVIVTPNLNQVTARVDQNITIMGFGFYRGDFNVVDKNVTISFVDANNAVGAAGSILNAHTRTVWGRNDLNILDTIHGKLLKYHKGGVGDTNDVVRSLAGVVFRTDINGAVGWSEDWNGITVYPDTNGEFDVNITVPYLTPSTIGRSDLNTLRATTTLLGDINAATFVITPNITMDPDANYSDMNVTVTIGGIHYQITDAMSQNLITNMQAVSNFIVRMGKIVGVAGTIELRAVTVRMNSDINMAKGPQRNYNDMNTAPVGEGRAEIDSTSMPEFAIDANIFLYNIKVPSGEMPLLARNGIVCQTTTCKNLDGTALSSSYIDSFQTDQVGNSVRTWTYNPTAGDGNLAFRVSTFSVYQAGTLSVEVVTPNGGEKIRTPRRNADANYTFTFTMKDTNVMDNNLVRNGGTPVQAQIYYSTAGGSKTGAIINDTNLFDVVGIRCNGWSTFGYAGSTIGDDVNLAQTKTCVFDVNRSDLNYIVGEYVIDVNVVGPILGGGIAEKSVIGYSDANAFFNPPLIEITDTNLNTVSNFTMNNGLSRCPPSGCRPDINYVIDFNIYLPMDVNRDFNSGLPITDYNIHFYLGTTQYGITGARDFNNGNTKDTNMVPSGPLTFSSVSGLTMAYTYCTQPSAGAPFFDYSCKAEFDLNWTPEGRYFLIAKIFNREIKASGVRTQTSWTAHTIDANELWDINASALSFVVNDDNMPRASPNRTASTTSSSYAMALTCDDNTSNIQSYLFRAGSDAWINNSTTSTYTFSIGSATLPATRTYYGGCLDRAGNISDINVTHNITFESSGGGPVTPPVTPPGGVGGVGGGEITPGTEKILEKTITNKPTAAEIASILTAAGASQTAIDKASAAVAKTSVARTITVEKITAADGTVSYKSTITISVENQNKSKKLTKVKVTEQIPKSVINTLRREDVTSNYGFEILKADPIIRFTIDSITPGSSAEISYSLNKQVTTGAANAWLPPVTAELQEAAPCDGVSCPDRACQTGRCNNTTGRCEYTNKADATVCEGTKECRSGVCVEKAAPAAVCGNAVCEAGEDSANCASDCPAAAAGLDLTLPAVAIVIILIVIAVAVYFYKEKKKPPLARGGK